MNKLLILSLLTIVSGAHLCADPGIMIDIDIIIHGPTGSDEGGMACKSSSF